MNEISNRTAVKSAVLGTNVEKLIRWAGRNPVDGLTSQESQVALVALLWSIHAPHDLRQFESLIRNLPAIFEELLDLVGEIEIRRMQEFGFYVEYIRDLVIHIAINERDIFSLLGGHISSVSSKMDVSPMHGSLTTYYTYAALMTNLDGPDRVDHRKKFCQLKAAVLYAHMIAINDSFSPQDYLLDELENISENKKRKRKRAEKAFKFIRHSSMYRYRNYLDQVFLLNSIRDLYSDLKNHADTNLQSYRDLMPLLKTVFKTNNENKEIGRGRGRKNVSSRRYRRNSWAGGFVEGRDGQFQERLDNPDGEDIEIISIPNASGEEDEAGLAEGENPVEYELIVVNDENEKASRSFSRYQIKHIEMANQHLPFDWGKNTTKELADFLKKCLEIIGESKGDLERETVCLCMIMLVTGESLESVRSRFKYCNLGSRFVSRGLIYTWDRKSHRGWWRIQPILPKQTMRLNSEQRLYCEKNVRGDVIDIPDVLNIGSYLRKSFTVEQLENSGKKNIFKRKSSTYRRCLNEIIDSVGPELRINEHRIRSHLFNQIVSEVSGDIAEGTLITGRYHPMAKTRIHYCSFNTNYLQEIYRQAVERTATDVYAEAYNIPIQKIPQIQLTSQEVIGSDYMPTISSIKDAIRTLRECVVNRLNNRLLSEIIQYHNFYTLYTVMMTGYCTGYRAVKDPFPAQIDVDPSDGLCLISDKDGSGYYNSRVVWLPEVLIDQLNYYQEHREVIMNYLTVFDENLSEIHTLPNLFFLDEKCAVEYVRPSTIHPRLASLLPLPINTNRRFLRTHLRQRGCSAEIIDAFMGHWARGEEPWGRYSTLSYCQIVQELKSYLKPLVQELGFKACRSQIHGL